MPQKKTRSFYSNHGVDQRGNDGSIALALWRNMPAIVSWASYVLVLLVDQETWSRAVRISADAVAVANEGSCNDAESVAWRVSSNDVLYRGNNRVPPGCTLVMAPSGISGDSGWGIFTLIPQKRGQRVMDQGGDIVIHIPDPNPLHAHRMRRFIWDYSWDGQNTGGHYEGLRVFSAISGFGALLNGVTKDPSLIHGFPTVDDAGLKRGKSPGAGAISHYHNYTWILSRDVDAGYELFIDYGAGWFKERGIDGSISPKKLKVSHLREVGYCLDNIVPGPSHIEGAGRGAFASRNLEEGAIVAPVPLLALSKLSLQMIKERKDGSTVSSSQLLQNYCFGHDNSSLLLYPYSHGVNFINHDSKSPNVELRWLKGSEAFFSTPLLELQQSNSTQLMMELVASRPISRGEEIALDYGRTWEKAWNDHIESWRPSDDGVGHASAESMNNDDKFFVLRTQQEQRTKPYPEHVFTSCYYQYSSHVKENDPPVTNSEPLKSVAKWRHDMIVSRNLRPCIIVQRRGGAIKDSLKADNYHLYTVHILNRPTLDEVERIPKGHVHFVTHVPRHAIVFSGKTYTSDQHMEKTFRKEISLEGLFPEQWKDLS